MFTRTIHQEDITLINIYAPKYWDTYIVRANNRSLSYILFISLILFNLPFVTTFGIVFTIAIFTGLAKTLTVVLAFKAIRSGSRIRCCIRLQASNCFILTCSVIQVIICAVWLESLPPFSDIDTRSEPEFIIVECNKSSVTAFYCVLDYPVFLALVSFIISFVAKNLPDTFNETKFLTFSMLVFCNIWVSFLSTCQSMKGKAMMAMDIFAILASSVGLLGCIFAPKCYVIMLRPDMNAHLRINFKKDI
ncbi:vomeronasal type-2 receptor 116-like [Trichechus inunguis]